MPRLASSLEDLQFLERKTVPLQALFVLVCVAGVVAGLVWAAVWEIDVVVRAPGTIRPFVNVSTVKNATPGPVGRKAYINGQRVTAGSVLWKIDTAATEVDLANATNQLGRLRIDLEQLDFYAASLESGQNAVPSRFPEAFNRAEAYLANTHRLQLVAQGKQEKWEQESRLPTVMTLTQKIKELKDDWQLSLLELQRLGAEEKEKVYLDRKALLTSIETLTQRRAELQRLIRESEVMAPISGVVDDVKKFNAQDFLMAGEEVLRIVPDRSQVLKLELKVDARDIAEVREGQTVHTLFSGLPPSRYGHVEATVANVPPDALVVNGELAYFLVEATLARVEVVDKKGRHLPLKPGMNADSRIVVSRKSILSFLLEKLEFIH